MSAEIVPIRQTRFRQSIPEAHQQSLDTRLQWLWNQRFGTVQTIWKQTTDVLDKTAATLILQAIMAQDLQSIALLFHRLEGGAISDDEVLAQSEPLRV